MTDEENAARESFLSDFRELLKLHSVTIDREDSLETGDVIFRGGGWFIPILEEANDYLKLNPLNYRSRKLRLAGRATIIEGEGDGKT